jgi:hypothetical protein
MENENKTANDLALPKATCANNPFLRKVKTVFNHLIYKSALDIVRTQGELAALAYVQQFVTVPLDDIHALITKGGK